MLCAFDAVLAAGFADGRVCEGWPVPMERRDRTRRTIPVLRVRLTSPEPMPMIWADAPERFGKLVTGGMDFDRAPGIAGLRVVGGVPSGGRAALRRDPGRRWS